MKEARITFEEVFNVRRCVSGRSSKRHTCFAFQFDGRRHYEVTICGWPQIEAGHTVTAILGEEENYYTMEGWRNLTTGEVAAPVLVSGYIGFLISIFLCCGFIFHTIWLTTPPLQVWMSVLCLMMAAMCCLICFRLLKQRRVVISLRAMARRGP